jgi:hypothetical protein
VVIFLDTEFTDLVIEPQLLSVGMVAASVTGGEFYAEVTDRRRIHAASWFALDAVLPQFGKVAHAACSYATLGARLCVFIDRLIASLHTDDRIEIAFSYDLDWELTERAMRDSGGSHIGDVTRRLNPQNVYDAVGFGAGKRAAEAYFAAEIDAPISRHHSLCDARALRIAYEAATRPGHGTHLTAPFRSASSPSAARARVFQEATP